MSLINDPMYDSSNHIKALKVEPEAIFQLLKTKGKITVSSEIPEDAKFEGMFFNHSEQNYKLIFSHPSFPEVVNHLDVEYISSPVFSVERS